MFAYPLVGFAAYIFLFWAAWPLQGFRFWAVIIFAVIMAWAFYMDCRVWFIRYIATMRGRK